MTEYQSTGLINNLYQPNETEMSIIFNLSDQSRYINESEILMHYTIKWFVVVCCFTVLHLLKAKWKWRTHFYLPRFSFSSWSIHNKTLYVSCLNNVKWFILLHQSEVKHIAYLVSTLNSSADQSCDSSWTLKQAIELSCYINQRRDFLFIQ